ncbi:MAG: GNAT family N-acetyltransferase [Paracoccaceae bacterium]|nr:GNAT family N-acetyltransferase [Paracoccaceae bacterium]
MDEFPEILEQDGLRLRPPTQSDLPAIASQINDDRVAPWLATVTRPFDDAAARALLDHGRHPGEHLRLIERNGTRVGGVCLGRGLWFWLAPAFWGNSIMHRALTLAIGTRFQQPAPPLIATCHDENSASRALLARLGFARSPTGRRMFFHGKQSSEPCHDHLLTPEQWHLLHPPIIVVGRTRLRPARQVDAATLALMLPQARDGRGLWPEAEGLPTFIETHRFRGPRQGLFMVEDDTLRSVGMALIQRPKPALRFLDDTEQARHRADAEAALAIFRAA